MNIRKLLRLCSLMGCYRKVMRRFDIRWGYFNRLGDPARILDLGCGSGYNSVVLKPIYPEVEIYGVDIIDKGEVPHFINYQAIDLDLSLLPYPDDFFDTIIFSHVIEHLRSPFELGNEINRVMKPGGTIYVETLNWTTMLVPSFGFKREQHIPFNFFDDPSHIKPWTKHGLFEFLYNSCHLRVKSVGTVRNWARIPLDLIKICSGFIKGNRKDIVLAFWNLYGWCIYAIGVKD